MINAHRAARHLLHKASVLRSRFLCSFEEPEKRRICVQCRRGGCGDLIAVNIIAIL